MVRSAEFNSYASSYCFCREFPSRYTLREANLIHNDPCFILNFLPSVNDSTSERVRRSLSGGTGSEEEAYIYIPILHILYSALPSVNTHLLFPLYSRLLKAMDFFPVSIPHC